jgi:hypothetical protein
MLRPSLAVVHRAASGQAAQTAPKRAIRPSSKGRSGAASPAGQVTVPAAKSMLKASLVNRPPGATGGSDREHQHGRRRALYFARAPPRAMPAAAPRAPGRHAVTGARPRLHAVPDEPDQVPRLLRFREQHPEVSVTLAGFWYARRGGEVLCSK